ncbi:MAG: hypothetical protein AAGD35_17885 [Actinomycetota bacterium]
MSSLLPSPPALTATEEVADGVRLERTDDHLRIVATRPLKGLATGWFNQPAVHVAVEIDDLPRGTRLTGYSFAQFAWPVTGSGDEPFEFHPAPNVHSMPVVLPLLLAAPDGRVALLAPLDAWHEQVIGVVQDDGGIRSLRWGWHGDLDEVPEGFAATLGLYEGTSAEALLRQWGEEVMASVGTVRPGRYDDPVVSHLSYWTDNGAAYWYRTEPGDDLPTTLERKAAELRDLGVPIGSFELDSWFYHHEISRPVTDVGYLEEVPPTGMLEWTPRPDVLPDGIEPLRRRLGDPPLVLHARHVAPTSSYVDDDWWTELSALPEDPSFFRRWFDDAARWGATAIEQDWMVMVWFGLRELRRVPGRALAWQRGLDEAAGDNGLSLIWCMPTPADLLATLELDNVVAVRTSDDYRYAADPADLWYWYLTVNRLAWALGLTAFKDCFFSHDGTGLSDGDDGFGVDPHAEVEAVLSAFSAGIVGIGDRIGRTDVDRVRRLCRPDGMLIKPDRPMAIADQSLFRRRSDNGGLCWATTNSGPWRYVLAIHTAEDDRPIGDALELEEEYLLYDWRAGTARVGRRIDCELARRDWSLHVCCPIEVGPDGSRTALIGDPDVYVTMGDTRIDRSAGSAAASVIAADGEDPPPPLRWTEGAEPELARG